ncbi:hypothetical protein BX616_006589 [Lobosporangium transversale]|nr:hypothetical protein BX616_006589 [Lobosporangium transversale]
MSSATDHINTDPSRTSSPPTTDDTARNAIPEVVDPVDPPVTAIQEPPSNASSPPANSHNEFSSTVSEDVKALTEALTTPIREQIEAHEQAAAAVVAAVGASVTAESHADQTAQPESTAAPTVAPSTQAFDVSNIESLSPTTQDEIVKNQAAKTLQLIALSFSNQVSQTSESASTASGSATDDGKAASAMDPALVSLEQVLREHAAASAREAPSGVNAASSSSANSNSKLEDETNALAQAVLKAMQADALKSSQVNLETDSSSASLQSGAHQNVIDQSELHRVKLETVPTGESSSATSTSTSNPSRELFFEQDMATGKTQVKWITDSKTEPKEHVNSVLEDATVIQLALQTLMASTGITGLSELNVASGGLLAPPVGHFPAQGSDFGSSQDPAAPESRTDTEATAPPRKKRKTGGSSKQNTAASIPEGSPSFPCTFPGCEKVFARLYNLKSHSRTHTDERPFVCSSCKLAFSRNHDLRRHVKIHIGDKVFKCDGCGKSFSRLDALGRHRNNAKNRPGCQTVVETPSS